MEDSPDSPLCDVCHRQPACHFTHIIKDGAKTSRRLCPDCFAATATSLEKQMVEEAMTARCRFCGRLGCSLSSEFNFLTGTLEAQATCLPCRQMHATYLLAILEKIPQDLPAEAQAAAAQKARDAADDHVRQWLKQYGS